MFDITKDPTFTDFMCICIVREKYITPEIAEFMLVEDKRSIKQFPKDFCLLINYYLAMKTRYPQYSEQVHKSLDYLAGKYERIIGRLEDVYDRSALLFTHTLALYKIRLAIGPKHDVPKLKQTAIDELDNILSDESCPKLLYLYLIKFVDKSELVIDELPDIFCAHFDKFHFRYTFQDQELNTITRYMRKFSNRQKPRKLIKNATEIFNEQLEGDLATKPIVQLLRTASLMAGYDSRRYNEQIGKRINKQFLEETELDDKLYTLALLNVLTFKPVVIERLEQNIVNELLADVGYF